MWVKVKEGEVFNLSNFERLFCDNDSKGTYAVKVSYDRVESRQMVNGLPKETAIKIIDDMLIAFNNGRRMYNLKNALAKFSVEKEAIPF